MASRKLPSTGIQFDILEQQDNRCLYCGHEFGTLVIRKHNEWTWLEVNWDHMIPYVYCLANPDDNWAASCQLCNGYKAALLFDSILAIRAYILNKAIANEHNPLPFWDLSQVGVKENSEILSTADLGNTEEIEADVSLVNGDYVLEHGIVECISDENVYAWRYRH